MIDADLGGGVVKQRIARKGAGKSGGFRVLMLLRIHKLAIFVHGFAKNEMGNIEANELVALKKLASVLLRYESGDLASAVASGALSEVKWDGENQTIP
jgi:hypothetical protein